MQVHESRIVEISIYGLTRGAGEIPPLLLYCEEFPCPQRSSLHCRSQLPGPVSVPSPICVNPAANLRIKSPQNLKITLA